LAKTWQKAFDDLRKGWNDPKRELRDFSFDQSVVVSGTKPVLLGIKNELFEIPRQSWRSLYVIFLATFYAYAEYRNAIKSVVSWSSRNDFLREPQKIGRTVFVETNLSALQIFNQIRDVLELCDISLEKVHIAYFSLKKETIEEKSSLITEFLSEPAIEIEQTSDNVAQSEFSLRKDKKDESAITPTQNQKSSQNDILAPYKRVLAEKFDSGFRMGDFIHRNRFRHFYEEINAIPLNSSDMELDNTLEMCGMVYDGRLYVIENLLDESTKVRLLESIEEQLNLHPRLYLEILFERFADDFRGTAIESMDILKTYLQALPDFDYYINKDRVFRDESFRHVGSPKDEVKRLLEEEHRPMSDDEIFKKLDWIPQQKILNAFTNCSNTQEILSNGDRSRFVLETFDIAGDEIEWLSEWIKQELDNSDFIGSMDAVKALKSRYSDITERNSGFRDLGIRNAIAVLLGDDFDFKGNLIVKKGKVISNEDLFKNFCESRESFTVDDIDLLANSLGVPAFYDVIYGNSFRLNERDFVQSVPKMDVDAIDDVIETFVRDKEFIPLKKIDFWGNFPIVRGNWNHFMLESFLWRCSKKFKLVHSNFSKTTYAGAIVRNNVAMDFEDVLVHALSEENFDAGRAKKFLKEEGYLAREKCSNVDFLLEKSLQLRTSRK
jgi:hypothetical protein